MLDYRFCKHFLEPKDGYRTDINTNRIKDLQTSFTKNTKSELNDVVFTAKKNKLSDANIYIIIVPTPLNEDTLIYQNKSLLQS